MGSMEKTQSEMSSKASDLASKAKDEMAGMKDRVMERVEDRDDIPAPMRALKGVGVTSGMAYAAGIGSILLSLTMWFFRRGGERETAERVAIFVGLWPPTFMAIGKALEGYEHPGR